MKIARIEAIPLEIPFDHGAEQAGFPGQDWSRLNIVIVRVETDTGLVGHGEAFSYNCRRAVQAVVEDMIAPVVVGRELADVGKLMHELQETLHLFGRYGITMFALSGLDIALWDLTAKARNVPLHEALGGRVRDQISAYSSLFRYRDPEMVGKHCRTSLTEGYRYVKLHETTEPEVRAARDALGGDFPLMIDTNCPWTPEEAHRQVNWIKDYDPFWLEEPIFPPEDFAELARLQSQSGIPLAAGENACTEFEFRQIFAAAAMTYPQPSVTKVGGITQFLRVAADAQRKGLTVMPHSPYFGPGFLATLHLSACLPAAPLVERFYLQLEASLYGNLIDPRDGQFELPGGAGLGPDPDPDVIRDYRVG